jgi:hypothetical protein
MFFHGIWVKQSLSMMWSFHQFGTARIYMLAAAAAACLDQATLVTAK